MTNTLFTKGASEAAFIRMITPFIAIPKEITKLSTSQPNRHRLDQLEMIRGFAATYVVLHHLSGDRIFLLRFGQEAVILFFLLSGFVIYHSVNRKPKLRFREYFILRSRRIFPIFIIALGLAFICLNPTDDSTASNGVKTFLGNLFMMQDLSLLKPGVLVNVFCGNSPLWSLSYEWWFYMMFFPIYKYIAPRHQASVAFFISGIGFLTYSAFPNGISLYALYFFIWWSGVELARTYMARCPITFVSEARSLLALGILILCLAWSPANMILQHKHFLLGVHPILELRHFGAAFSMIVLGLLWHQSHWIFFRQIFGIFGLIAPISYALYAFHVPLLVDASYLKGWMPPWVAYISYLVITLVAAYSVEVIVQRKVNHLLQKKS